LACPVNESQHMNKSGLPLKANAIAALRRPTELGLLGCLLVIYLLVYVMDAKTLYRSVNMAGPVAMTAILGWSCYRIVMQSPVAVWAPLFWFRLASATYYGFGALVPHIVNEETLQYIFSFYYFDDNLNLKVNLIYCFGIFCTLMFSYIFLRQRNIKADDIELIDHRNKSRMLFFSVLFLLIGGCLRYALRIPYTFGLTQTVLPGTIMTLSNIYYVGIYLLIRYGMSYSRKTLPFAFILIGFDIFVSVASFAKTELLLLLIFSFLGLISNSVSKARVVVGATCVVLAFFSFQSLVGYGRDQLVIRYNSILGAGLEERLDIVRSYISGDRESVTSTRQNGLLRLSYVSVSAFAIDRYDAGNSGDTFRNTLAVFVPRILWPGKPIITELGTETNYLLRGNYDSAWGVGHFAEAYWNFGWGGFIPYMAVLAAILSIYTRISMGIMVRQNWLMLPVVFIGANIGLRVDGFFVPDVLGPAWVAICFGLVLLAAGSASWRRDGQWRQLAWSGSSEAARILQSPDSFA
jgi:hypothetical protein